MERVIFHCDLNSFYASVELLDHPELRGQPAAVCGDPTVRHGIILAKNEPAKAKGVQTAETIWQARQKCPGLVLLPAHHEKYTYYSNLAKGIYCRYTDLVEPFGIDENWLDMTGTWHLFGPHPVDVANQIRRAIREELGLTISVGVSFNKVFAKLGSDFQKPDAITDISRENFRDLVWPLPVTELLFVGKASAKVLQAQGIHTIGELAAASQEGLTRLLGKHGMQLHQYATGEEHSPVRPAGETPPPKSVGKGLTFRRNLRGEAELKVGVTMLAERVAMGLRRHGMKCTTLQISVRSPEFRTVSRQKRLDVATNLSRELIQQGMELLHQCWNMEAPVRALTITATGLLPEEEAGVQLDLFGRSDPLRRERQENLERTMDRLRDKYGRKIISFGASRSQAARDIAGEDKGETE